jgi:hypothetical protein
MLIENFRSALEVGLKSANHLFDGVRVSMDKLKDIVFIGIHLVENHSGESLKHQIELFSVLLLELFVQVFDGLWSDALLNFAKLVPDSLDLQL